MGLLMDGTAAIRTADGGTYNTVDKVSLAGWFYTPSSSGNTSGDSIFELGGTSVNRGFFISIPVVNVPPDIRVTQYKAASNQITGQTTFTEDTWHHVCVVSDSTAGTCTFYLDGSSIATDPSYSRDLGNCRVAVGSTATNGAKTNGRFAEIATWDGVLLSSTEVGNLYNGGAGGGGMNPQAIQSSFLTSYWDCRTDGTDVKGNANLTVLSGTPSYDDTGSNHPTVDLFTGGSSIPAMHNFYSSLRG